MPTIIVTGASAGVGRATVLALVERGASVVATARSTDPLATLADLAPDQVETVVGDLTNPTVRLRVVEAAIARFGAIDGLVNNAGVVAPVTRSVDAEPDAWAANLALNLIAPVHLVGLALPALRRAGGRVVNLSSGVATHPVAGWGAYCAAKAALRMATEVLALEEPDIVALSLRPGMVDTGMQSGIREHGHEAMDPDAHRGFIEAHDEGALLDPALPGASVAAVVLGAPAAWSGSSRSWSDEDVRALVG